MDPSEIPKVALHLLIAKYIQVAGISMLIFDHMLTFNTEVEKVWKKPPSLGNILFFINRYGTPLQYAAIINAFHDPSWTRERISVRCEKYSVFEGASSVAMVGVIMIIRVYALYHRSKYVLGVLLSLWTIQLVLSAIGLSTGHPISLPPGLVGCIHTGTHKLFPSLWVTPLVTDSVVFFLTMWRGRQYLFNFHGSPTNHVFVRDGAVYFLIIFLSNLANTLIFFVTTRADLKPIAASFNQLLTSTIISRLYLNLRSAGAQARHETTLSHDAIRFKRWTRGVGIPNPDTIDVTDTSAPGMDTQGLDVYPPSTWVSHEDEEYEMKGRAGGRL
ncbi:hypothetical protein BKA70DRAFT_1468675 [Coprinopsis sp. MPI-PUGE-AT-0042]|nr:hypothetical protein BKA70DRAFT_1468675 [Coprinopsis sp. MPI-PUGE-AT-0042]